ncbi:hypothetical protein BDQ12DRAFT_728482 [Crucibulum laeve]|uniref:Uncharacterized protein n=1 Tax=Crucibulum laeve TaxID=68775 RepID=A0A5C3LII0_9AGAR|nr:hypothetical protein BDQ12DRAFT_728482 [Crucibulum laeve]
MEDKANLTPSSWEDVLELMKSVRTSTEAAPPLMFSSINQSTTTIPTPPPASPFIGQAPGVEAFVPPDTELNDNDPVLPSVDKITPYLTSFLRALGLYTEARTSFIT